jgi:predicted regulator of Ras-like GTPase activity (Roadblock/LC7/MglB family)
MALRDRTPKKGKRAEIEETFQDVLLSDKIITIILTSQDGLPIASGRPQEAFPEPMISALTATLMATSEQMGNKMNLGSSRSQTVELDGGILLLREVRDRVTLGIILEKDANLAYYEVEMQRLVRQIDKILFPDIYKKK